MPLNNGQAPEIPDTGTGIFRRGKRNRLYRAVVLIARYLVEHGRRIVAIDATGNRRRFMELARQCIPQFAEIYIRCPIEVCKVRESGTDEALVEKRMYQKAEEGKLKGGVPGATAPYEEPSDPEVVVPSDLLGPEQAAQEIMNHIKSRWLKGRHHIFLDIDDYTFECHCFKLFYSLNKSLHKTTSAGKSL